MANNKNKDISLEEIDTYVNYEREEIKVSILVFSLLILLKFINKKIMVASPIKSSWLMWLKLNKILSRVRYSKLINETGFDKD